MLRQLRKNRMLDMPEFQEPYKETNLAGLKLALAFMFGLMILGLIEACKH